MIKRFYSSSDERFLKEQSVLMFEEISDGVYLVIKDRVDRYMEYATSNQVAEALNHIHKVVVVHKGNGSGYANWNFDRPFGSR
jgi:hypothetical protein